MHGLEISKATGSRIGRKSQSGPVKVPRRSLDAAERRLVKYHSYFAKGTKEDIYFRATRDIVLAARCWRKVANNRVAPLQQTMARWETLYLVAFSNENLNQGELAQRVGVKGPTMVRMLDALARDGLIKRYQHESDRRVMVTRITPEGMRIVYEIMDLTNKFRAEVLQGIDPKHLVICIDVLARIIRRLDEVG